MEFHDDPTDLEHDLPTADADDMTRRQFLEEAGQEIAAATLATMPFVTDGAAARDDHRHEKKITPLTIEELRELLPKRVAWKKVGELMREGHHCVDGRCTERGACRPGGDEALFIICCATMEELLGRPLRDDEIGEVFQIFLSQGKIYMHTDAHKEHDLAAALRSHPELARFIPSDSAAKSVTRKGLKAPEMQGIPPEAECALWQLILASEHQGCGHLAGMLQFPQYRVRRGLVEACLKLFYKELWCDAASEHLETLSGDHKEEAVVSVEIEGGIQNEQSLMPAVAPCGPEGRQFFVNHPQYTGYRITRLRDALEPLLRRFGIPGEEFSKGVLVLDRQQTQETLHRLAKGKPLYTAKFRQGETDPDLRFIETIA